jgi:hypothetical protein
MTIRIFISGPIRPSEDAVRRAVLTIRSAFPDAITYLFTWKTANPNTKLREEVDYYLEEDEPVIRDKLATMPLYRGTVFWPESCYKMMYAVNKLCEFANPSETDIIIRIRTDAIFQFHTQTILHEILSLATRGYIAWFSSSSGHEVFFNDWFGIAQYSLFKHGWRFETIEEFNYMYSFRINPEHVIRNNLISNNVSIFPLDMRYVNCYLLRKKDGGIIEEYH